MMGAEDSQITGKCRDGDIRLTCSVMVCGCCEKRIFHEKACIIRKMYAIF